MEHGSRGQFKDAPFSHAGQAMITLVVLMLVAGLLIFFGAATLAVNETRVARRVLVSERSFFVAEAGVEDVAYRIITGKQYPASGSLGVNDGTATVTVAIVGNTREIVSQGNIALNIRSVKSVLTTTTGVSFPYGTQIGDGGLVMENNSQVNGSVYSNGHITGNNSPRITGDAFAAASSTISGMTIDAHARAHRLEENTIGGSATSTTVIYRGSVGLNAWADRFSGGTISGNAYYKTSVSATTTVNGSQIQTASAPTNLAKLDMPITNSVLDQWEQEALAGGTATSSCSSPPYKPADGTLIGPKKIPCDVEIDGTKIVTLTGTLWVSGNFKMQNSAQLKLAPLFCASSPFLSGIVVADKRDEPIDRLASSKVSIQNSAQILGCGSGSYIMAVSRNNSAETGGSEEAFDIGNSSTAAIYYAPHGLIELQNNVNLKEATSWKMQLKNSAAVTYESGLANVQFSSGPTGGFRLQSWNEVE